MIIDLNTTAYCINIKDREDRWNRTKKEFNKLNSLKLERVDACIHATPRKGLIRTFKNIVAMAKNNNLPYVIIIEDDIWIIDTDKVKNALNDIPDDWDILLGGVYFMMGFKVKNKHWASLDCFCSTHFTIIRDTIYDKVLDFTEDSPSPIDRLLSNLSKENKKIYVMNPMPCRQFGGFSDIRKKHVDYNDRNLPFCDVSNPKVPG